MNRTEWAQPIGDAAAYRRATGRARHNKARQEAAERRRQRVKQLIRSGMDVNGIAAACGVSRATAYRDIHAIITQVDSRRGAR